jgi:hypothetical protein
VIACSLPSLVEMYVSWDDGIKLITNDDGYYDVVYFTVMVVSLNVLYSCCKYYSCIINMAKILKIRIYFSHCFCLCQSNPW